MFVDLRDGHHSVPRVVQQRLDAGGGVLGCFLGLVGFVGFVGYVGGGRGIPLMSNVVESVLIHYDERGSRVLLRSRLPVRG